MNIKQKVLFGAVAVAALVGGFYIAQWLNEPTLPQSGQAAAMPTHMVEFTLPDVNDKPHNINQWRGKLILLNFWATWCPPCREEIPLFISMQDKYGKQGLQIIGVAIDKKQDVETYADFNLINYPILVGQEEVMTIMKQYGNRLGTLPYTVVIDSQGRVLSRKVGAYKRPELEALLDGLLPEA
ncbi:MAG: TlpA disulfide reductase family protein [Acidiferrobacterales bacterium]